MGKESALHRDVGGPLLIAIHIPNQFLVYVNMFTPK